MTPRKVQLVQTGSKKVEVYDDLSAGRRKKALNWPGYFKDTYSRKNAPLVEAENNVCVSSADGSKRV